MKVVINESFGGFWPSDAAAERCIELGMSVTRVGEDGQYENPGADFSFDPEGRGIGGRYFATQARNNAFRCDPRFVQAVEELGERANGLCSLLKVVQIPFDGPEGWEISEYDGLEHVAECHRSWA